MKDLAEVTLDRVEDGVAYFTVTFTGKKQAQRYFLWLSLNDVVAAGDENPDAFAPVNQWVGDSASVSIPAVAGHSYEAFVSLWPDVWTPRSNTVEF